MLCFTTRTMESGQASASRATILIWVSSQRVHVSLRPKAYAVRPSNSVTTITGSLIELSNLVVKEGRQKIIVKIMYDRGSLEQLYNSHAPVPSEKWKPLDLPGADEIPGLDLEVIVSQVVPAVFERLIMLIMAELPSGLARHFPCQVFDSGSQSRLDKQQQHPG